MQNFSASRLKSQGGKALLAYDSTTFSTYSGQIPEARYGFNKAHDGMATVKLLALYCAETRQPVAFAKQPGNQPDVITIGNTLKQLSAIGIGKAEIIGEDVRPVRCLMLLRISERADSSDEAAARQEEW